MRNRNILKGRCGHRPLQTATKNSTNFEGGQSRPPLQPVLENRVWVEKSPRFPFRVGVGRCRHRPLQMVLKITRVRRKIAAFSVSPTPKKREHPARGRMGTTDEARGGAFRVMSSGLSA
jgi:hypothetical protein